MASDRLNLLHSNIKDSRTPEVQLQQEEMEVESWKHGDNNKNQQLPPQRYPFHHDQAGPQEAYVDEPDVISSFERDDENTKASSAKAWTGDEHTTPMNESSTITSPHDVDPFTSRARFAEVINEQFDLEIILKHRELEAIEQELGKTQACLEQLRRCSLLPYPTSQEMMDGTGPQLRPAGGGQLPQWAPPWGVVDGPYTRHYSQWLLPDQRFDGNGNIIRINTNEHQVPQSTRPQRASVMKAQQLKPAADQVCYYAKKDGSVVKLQCMDCKRGDFSSAQGFINHCRISHQRDYASHEAAAEQSGVPISEAEMQIYLANRASRAASNAGIVSITRQGSSSNTSVLRDRKRANQGKNTVASKKGNNLVEHPLTPPTDPVDAGPNPSRPQVAHLKSLLMKKHMAVDEIDTVADDIVNRTGAVEQNHSEDEDSEIDETPSTKVPTTKAGRTFKPAGTRTNEQKPSHLHRVTSTPKLKLKLSSQALRQFESAQGVTETPTFSTQSGKDLSRLSRMPSWRVDEENTPSKPEPPTKPQKQPPLQLLSQDAETQSVDVGEELSQPRLADIIVVAGHGISSEAPERPPLRKRKHSDVEMGNQQP